MTNRVRLLVVLVWALLVAGAARAEDLKVGKLVKVYAGSEGEEVAIVHLEGGTRALIRFKGVDGEFEGKVFLHDVHDLDNRGVDYQMKYQGKDYVSVLARSAWGGDRSWEIYPPGPGAKDGIRVRYHEGKSAAMKPEQLLAEYLQQQRSGSAAVVKKPTPVTK